MNVEQKFYLTKEEKRKVDGALKMHGLTYEDIAKELKVSRPAISLKLAGKRPVYLEQRKKIYELLKQDSLVSFLADDTVQAETQQQPDKKDMWHELYSQAAERISEIFDSKNTEVKGRILSDLEKLVDKYDK